MADNQTSGQRNIRLRRVIPWCVFTLLLLSYWGTTPWSVSYWDCPEYVVSAVTLIPGHPPGNPLWMLIEHTVTLLCANAPQYAALLVNLSSGLFTALAGLLMYLSLEKGLRWMLTRRVRGRRDRDVLAVCGAAIGSLCYGWCDSSWYSAVEAEVYALSIMLTALTVWIMVKAAFCPDPPGRRRLFILCAYILGLSIGAHQLNLLAIPALAVIYAFRGGHSHTRWHYTAILLLSCGTVGCILAGMMPSTIMLSAALELFCVNTLGLPYLTGAWVYAVLLTLSALTAIIATYSSRPRTAVMFVAILPFAFLSGFFIFAAHVWVGLVLSAVFTAWLVWRGRGNSLPSMVVWSMSMVLAGYSVYALILLRGAAPSPINGTQPGTPFAFASYLARDQYGAAPLIYGKTAYSRPMLLESIDSAGNASYTELYIRDGKPIYIPAPADSLRAAGHDTYFIKGHTRRPTYTPELDMWFPRIVSPDPSDLKSFESWAGMTRDDMTRVRVTEAVDSGGRFVARMAAPGEEADSLGRRIHYSYRPTYMQNLRMLLGYQMGYMYFRYLLWNFCGRQNDIPSTGEVEHGNFITGFTPVDNLMLGADDQLPPEEGRDNKGRNPLFMLPLLLGIAGIVWLLRSGPRAHKVCTVIAALFVLTGVAIVVYLNQSPGEPRERDYSFLGSFMAYAAWIGCGAVWLAILLSRMILALWQRKCHVSHKSMKVSTKVMTVTTLAGFIPSAAVAVWMFYVNLDDHDRTGREVAHNIAANLLNSLEPDAILFVNGDNYTFPLWYMQEVEGLRRDVRVVNWAYLSLPQYFNVLTADWRGERGVLLGGDYADYLRDRFQTVPFAPDMSGDTVPAMDFFRDLHSMAEPTIHHRYISFTDRDGHPVVVDLKEAARMDGYLPLMQRRLALIEIVAANESSESPRPLHWQRSIASGLYTMFGDRVSHDLLTFRYGGARPDSVIILEAEKLTAPNGDNTDVYMDETPRLQIASQRAGVVIAGQRLLSHGDARSALHLARIADSLYGSDETGYGSVVHGSSVYRVGDNLSRLYIEAGRAVGDSSAVERGRHILQKQKARNARRQHYLRSLPPRLRDKALH